MFLNDSQAIKGRKRLQTVKLCAMHAFPTTLHCFQGAITRITIGPLHFNDSNIPDRYLLKKENIRKQNVVTWN